MMYSIEGFKMQFDNLRDAVKTAFWWWATDHGRDIAIRPEEWTDEAIESLRGLLVPEKSDYQKETDDALVQYARDMRAFYTSSSQPSTRP